MRVLIATGLYPPDIGGPATYAKLLHDHLPKRGIEVRIVTFGDVLYLPKGIRHVAYFFKVLWFGTKVDGIYALDPWSVGVPSCVAAKLLRKPFFVRIAGDYAWEQGVARYGITEFLDTFAKRTEGYPFFIQVVKRGQCFVAKSARIVIVPSHYLKGIVCNWGVRKNSIEVIYSVFEGVGKVGNKNALRSMLSFEGKLLITAGRFTPWKGFGTLIELMPNLLKQFPDVKLIIAGDGPLRTQFERRIHELGLSEIVILPGSLDQSVLHSYIAAADVFVLNSSYEGFSHLLLEVMTLTTPIVTTRVGGNVELIEDGVQGMLVDYDDREALQSAIARLFIDTALTQRITKNAYARTSMFRVDSMLEQLVPLFKKLLS